MCIIIERGNQERFLNLCRKNNILLWKINKQEEKMTLNMGLKQFKSVLPIIRKTGVKFKIQKKAGLPFFFDKYRKRKMFFAGVIFCGAMIYIFSLFIWDIEIQGNSQLTDEVLFDYLGSENVRYGSYKYSIDSDELEKKLREHYD